MVWVLGDNHSLVRRRMNDSNMREEFINFLSLGGLGIRRQSFACTKKDERFKYAGMPGSFLCPLFIYLDFDGIRKWTERIKRKLILCFSSYPTCLMFIVGQFSWKSIVTGPFMSYKTVSGTFFTNHCARDINLRVNVFFTIDRLFNSSSKRQTYLLPICKLFFYFSQKNASPYRFEILL